MYIYMYIYLYIFISKHINYERVRVLVCVSPVCVDECMFVCVRIKLHVRKYTHIFVFVTSLCTYM